MKSSNSSLAAVAPTEAAARSAAAYLARGKSARLVPFSLARYLRSARAPSRIVLCPAGRDPVSDLAFLRDASRRLLWPRPADLLSEAIEGMLGLEERRKTASGRRRRQPVAPTDEAGGAYFVEGAMTPARAEALAAAGVRRWIAVHPRAVRIGGRLFTRLDRLGVRWLALEPIEAAAVLASPALASSRSRWKPLLPEGVRVWVRKTR